LAVAQVHVDLVAVEEHVWSGEADLVIARTVEGELGVLPGHAPVLGQLAEPSEVKIRKADGDLVYEVSGGFLSVTPEGVTILAQSAAPVSASQ
jgi:F-type H+-transporting ATPase subunit epsilon